MQTDNRYQQVNKIASLLRRGIKSEEEYRAMRKANAERRFDELRRIEARLGRKSGS